MKAQDPLALLCIKDCKDTHLRNGQVCLSITFLAKEIMNSVLFQFSSVKLLNRVQHLRPHGLQRARPPCPLPTPRAAQTHVRRAGDAIQPCHPLLSPSPPALNLSQHQGLFQ